ncbi:hypothetical protein SLEP1_g56489 [Rubroshorea leprosula]|uniref:Uncharacterized protein n=1 Tax=Rubroshorea leprosula TaxID=152421 RepID=A0AAV5MIM7_9ROSI|nr:hypothetical protein SLEP1_g56489 [Rubroshorea leprosula]
MAKGGKQKRTGANEAENRRGPGPQVSPYEVGGLLFKQGGSSLEHATALSFLLLVYGRTLGQAKDKSIVGRRSLFLKGLQSSQKARHFINTGGLHSGKQSVGKEKRTGKVSFSDGCIAHKNRENEEEVQTRLLEVEEQDDVEGQLYKGN